jgi:hypothetical protein
MLGLHDDFRKRHGLPIVPSPWTLDDHLSPLHDRRSLIDPSLLDSPRPLIGTIIERLRRGIAGLLHAIFYRQTELNRDVLLTLEALTRDSQARRSAYDALSSRVVELERTVARLEGKGE